MKYLVSNSIFGGFSLSGGIFTGVTFSELLPPISNLSTYGWVKPTYPWLCTDEQPQNMMLKMFTISWEAGAQR